MQDAVSRVCSNANLDRIGRAIGLDDCIVRKPAQRNHVAPVLMTAAFEALIYAVYEDSGRTIAIPRIVMRTLGLWPEQ